MNFRHLRILVVKEARLNFRSYESTLGVIIFNALLTVLVCALFRNVQVAPAEVGLLACPYLWIILVLSVFRIVLQSVAEESRKGLYLKQVRDGFRSSEIFAAKLISGLISGLLVVLTQTVIFVLLMGYQEIALPVFYLGMCYALALPALVSLSIIGAYISHRSSSEEVLMPIILLPLILLLSVAVVSQGEIIFTDLNLASSTFWFKVVLGLQLVLVLVSELLFRVLVKLKV